MRRKKVISVSLPEYVYADLEELSMLTGWNRSKIVEMAVATFVSEKLKTLKDRRKEEEKQSKDDEEKLREEWWRKVLLGEIHADKWIRDYRWG
jgi:metal-responsive CopG/Arc/MetJ family transcriptional regulator